MGLTPPPVPTSYSAARAGKARVETCDCDKGYRKRAFLIFTWWSKCRRCKAGKPECVVEYVVEPGMIMRLSGEDKIAPVTRPPIAE